MGILNEIAGVEGSCLTTTHKGIIGSATSYAPDGSLFVLTDMKTFYIQAAIHPHGIDRIIDCGFLCDADTISHAFDQFTDHYEEQWGVGITYTVTLVFEVPR